MGDPIFGIGIRQIDEEPRPAIPADLSTVGLIGPMADADPVVFPLNTPVMLNSTDVSKTIKLGSENNVADAVRGINDQLADMQMAARIIIVRTAAGVDANPALALQKTINNIVGSSLLGTGVWAFTKAVAIWGFTPRVIAAPGFDGLQATSIGQISAVLHGTGYVEGTSYPLTLSGGGTGAVQATAHAIGQSDGTLGPAVIDTLGAWYTSAPTVAAPAPPRHLTTAVVAAGGTGHAVSDVISLPNGVKLTVTAVNSGAITTADITDLGNALATPPTNPVAQSSTTGTGTGATFTLTYSTETTATYTATVSVGANPIVASLTGMLDSVIGHAVIESAGVDYTTDISWRSTFASKRLIPTVGGVRVTDPLTGDVVMRPIAGRVIGRIIARDFETGAPFHSAANQPIQGIVGPGRDIAFTITSDTNEGQELLAANMGFIARGQVGNEFAIAQAGFIYIGTDTASDDTLWQFYNQTRGRDFIHLTAIRALRFYLGKYNITGHTITALLTTLKGILRDLKANEDIIDYRVYSERRATQLIRSGWATSRSRSRRREPAVLRKIIIESARYRPALDAMVADLAAQFNMIL
jgi:phage tail sheath protein FI